LREETNEYRQWINQATGSRIEALNELEEASRTASEAQASIRQRLESIRGLLTRIAEIVSQLTEKLDCNTYPRLFISISQRSSFIHFLVCTFYCSNSDIFTLS
ncbi:unnamed protein product, partial [Protopolystoma xenopodis]